MIKKFAVGSIFVFSNSVFEFMRAELDGVPCAVRLYDGMAFTEDGLIKEGYENPKVLYENLDDLLF